MIFYAGDMVLESVRQVFEGDGNSVSVCRDIKSPIGTFYILLAINDRDLAKRVISVFENSSRAQIGSSEGGSAGGPTPYVACFTQNALLCYLFDYREERNIHLFADSQIHSPSDWEAVSVNLVLACIVSPLPFSLLALAIDQGNVHLEKDGSVFFTPYFDLSQLTDSDEADCATKCAELMLSLLHNEGKLKSAGLMRKKLAQKAFRSLPELYRDIRVTEIPQKMKPRERIASFLRNNKDLAFRILLIASVFFAIFALVVLISQLIFGNIPLFRLFESCFDIIGERSLKLT